MTDILYGPVSSWRLGSSLGVDLIAGTSKACSFDCVYCQLGDTVRPVVRRKEFVPLASLAAELETLGDVDIDHVTFSGMGEPTLASNLGGAIELARSKLAAPVVVLTNASLLYRDDVCDDLARADVVAAKLDAADEATFRRVNRPRMRCSLSAIVDSIKRFRGEYRGRLALQMMFVVANRDGVAGMARLAEDIGADEVQINTPLRPGGVEPLSPQVVDAIAGQFSSLGHVISVYRASSPAVMPLDPETTERRRSPAPQERGNHRAG